MAGRVQCCDGEGHWGWEAGVLDGEALGVGCPEGGGVGRAVQVHACTERVLFEVRAGLEKGACVG